MEDRSKFNSRRLEEVKRKQEDMMELVQSVGQHRGKGAAHCGVGVDGVHPH